MFGPTNVKEEVGDCDDDFDKVGLQMLAKYSLLLKNILSRMMVSTQEEIGTFCPSIRDTSPSIDSKILDVCKMLDVSKRTSQLKL